ncbi:MAG: hypothetical protein M3020_28760, partial [Myxococcota bacterium]|nr:hypothetical protein [Myxococcota bacterium]
MDQDSRFVALAESIDPERAKNLSSELGGGRRRALALLLATAFPPFADLAGERVDALDRLSKVGVRAGRRRRELT